MPAPIVDLMLLNSCMELKDLVVDGAKHSKKQIYLITLAHPRELGAPAGNLRCTSTMTPEEVFTTLNAQVAPLSQTWKRPYDVLADGFFRLCVPFQNGL